MAVKTPPVDPTYSDFVSEKIAELFQILALLRGAVAIVDSNPDRRDTDKSEDWLYLRRLCLNASSGVNTVLGELDASAFDFERKRTLTPSAGEGDATN